MAHIIIVNGAPGAGKTTLVKRLSEDLDIGFVTKDQIKELLGDTLGIPSGSFVNAAYGRAASEALLVIIDQLRVVDSTYIVESAFWADVANSHFADMAKETSLLQIYVTCDADIRKQRFENRAQSNGERHAVHGDALYVNLTPDELYRRYRPIEAHGLSTIMFDTTTASDDTYLRLRKKVEEWRSSHAKTN